MTDISGRSGIIENFVDYKTMTDWKNIFDKHFDTQELHQTKEVAVLKNNMKDEKFGEYLGKTKGIDKRHKGYLWFKRIILDPIQKHFSTEFHLMYAHFANSEKPLNIHQDYYPERIPEGMSHYASMLIPYTVEHDPEKCFNAATVLFTENGTMTQQEYDQYASHNNPICMQEFGLDKVYTWRTGDLIWWDAERWHGSNNFPLTCKNKQSLVIHTYA